VVNRPDGGQLEHCRYSRVTEIKKVGVLERDTTRNHNRLAMGAQFLEGKDHIPFQRNGQNSSSQTKEAEQMPSALEDSYPHTCNVR
jgi:hypothetical protein